MPKKEMPIVDRVQSVIKTPTKFFNAVQKEKGFKAPFTYLVVISIISSVLSYFFNPFLGGVSSLVGPGAGAAAVIFLWIAGLILSFIVYGFFHLFVILLGGKGGYENTYKVFVYSSTPLSLLAWVGEMFFGFGSSGIILGVSIFITLAIWGLYLLITGLSITHKISKLRALAVIVIPVIIVIILVAMLFAVYAIGLVSSGALTA